MGARKELSYKALSLGHTLSAQTDFLSNKPLILVVDDDIEDYALLEEACSESQFDCQLQHVGDGLTALSFLTKAERLPDLVILDVNLPRMRGLEFLASVRASPRLKRLPVLMMTAATQQETVDLAYEAGANAFFVKPHSFDDLVDFWRTMCRFWLEMARLPRSTESNPFG